MTNLFNHVFSLIFNFTNDYGIAITIFTVLVKLILLPLTIKQKKSMKVQQKLSVQVDDLKKKYKDDEEKLNKEMIALYKENPGSGLSILLLFIQMPILITMYRTFSSNILDASTVLLPWINNLSNPDPYFILPILYIGTQLLPSALATFGIIKNSTLPKLSLTSVLTAIIIGLMFLTKSPAALGIYFITSNIIINIEQFIPISD